MACHRAQSIGSACVRRVAEVKTLAVYAGQAGWTVRAGAAAKNTGHTLADLLTVAVIIPPAEWLADPVVTDLIDQTGLVVEADVLAELSITDLSFRALSVGGTSLGLLDTPDHRSGVRDEADWTGALGSVVDHLAVGTRSAGVSLAGVRATIVDAGVRLRAVRVGPAAHDAHLVETGMERKMRRLKWSRLWTKICGKNVGTLNMIKTAGEKVWGGCCDKELSVH